MQEDRQGCGDWAIRLEVEETYAGEVDADDLVKRFLIYRFGI